MGDSSFKHITKLIQIENGTSRLAVDKKCSFCGEESDYLVKGVSQELICENCIIQSLEIIGDK